MSGQRRRVVAVGLTGGIGAGKTTALALFAELGALTISADQLVHDLYARPTVSAVITAHFGPDVLGPDRAIDRARLAEIVRGRCDELAWLEELIHPHVAKEMASRLENAPEGTVVVCEVPLLFEAENEHLFDLIVTVEASGENRRKRSIHRFDLDQFSELEAMQASTETRVQRSDMAFFNDGDLDGLGGFVREVYARAGELLKEGR